MYPVLRFGLVAFCCAAITPVASLYAQTGNAAASSSAASSTATASIDPAKAMDAALSSVEKELVPLAEAMPAEKYSFAPSNTDFAGALKPNYTGVSTFGQEVAHAASANYYFGSVIGGMKPSVDVTGIAKGVDKETAVASLKASFAFLHQAVATLTPANAFEHVGNLDPLATRVGVLLTAVGHNNNHYGQLVEYLRMNGLTPPASQGRPAANPAKTK